MIYQLNILEDVILPMLDRRRRRPKQKRIQPNMRFVTLFCLAIAFGCDAFSTTSSITRSRNVGANKKILISSTSSSSSSSKSSRLHLTPLDIPDLPLLLADLDDDSLGDFTKNALIFLVFGGGLIPAVISANKAMFKTLFGKNQEEEDPAELKKIGPGESFDPTLLETKYRKYVEDSGATGPEVPFSALLFAPERVPVADIAAILGRIQDVNSVAKWKDLPSTKMPRVSSDAPMWLPRKAFKVNIRKAKFLGWPTDPKTGEPFGGQALKDAESSRVSKNDVLISDAALDAVFDSWAWGAGIATPDKVASTLKIYQKGENEFSLGDFVSAAIRGRSATGFAALFFIIIQYVAYAALFVGPTLRYLFDIDIGFGGLL